VIVLVATTTLALQHTADLYTIASGFLVECVRCIPFTIVPGNGASRSEFTDIFQSALNVVLSQMWSVSCGCDEGHNNETCTNVYYNNI
jgi:hypothetical protein